MYRHSAESIRETDNKMFVSLEEKTKYNNYENTLRKKEDSYSKTEADNKIKELSDNTYGNVESTYVSEANTIDGYIKDLEILGNTIQNTEDLSDIKSIGVLQEDNTYKMSIVSCGKNLFDKTKTVVGYVDTNGTFISGGGSIISDYIKVKPNINYINNKNLEKVIFYDKDKKFIELILGNNFPQIPDGCVYARVQYGNESTTTDTLQIEEGTISTPYEPYQESRVDINLPCQLEKVGGVSDRLYYDEEEKAWCIEKNIEKIIFTGSDLEGWAHKTFYDGNGKQYYGTPNDGYTFKVAGGISEFPVFISGGITRDYNGTAMTCSKTYGTIDYSVNIATLSEFKTWVNGKSIYVVPETSKKIILPLSTQIQLNSYANRTHIYTVSGDIEPTIKATLPKSLGASVQTLNDKTDTMNTRIKSIETLKEGQNLSYESDNGYVICENTNNGQIDNIKIEGKTLVNLTFGNFNTSGNSNFTIINDNTYQKECKITEPGSRVITKVGTFKKNTDYTIIADIRLDTTLSDNILISFYNGNKFTIEGKSVTKPTNGLYTKYVTKLNPKGNDVTGISIGYHGSLPLDTVLGVRNLIVLEGDWVNKELPSKYFEGLMSVGGDVDEIKVLSRKEDGNLWNSEVIRGFINADTGVENNAGGQWAKSKDFIRVKPNTTYYVSSNKLLNGILFFDKNKQIITTKFVNSDGYIIATTPSDCGFVRLRFRDATVDLIDHEQITDIMLIQSSTPKQYIPHKSHNKSLLYYNDSGELVPVPELHEWDSIEKHSDGKWYYHKRSEKVILNGSEGWYLNNESVAESNTLAFYIPTKPKAKNLLGIICDLFHTDINIFKMDYECIRISSDQSASIYIRINKSRLSSENVEGFKTWLSSNNVTVVYELAEEQVYECVNLNLDTYDNETMIICNSGSITPNLSLNVSSHIGNTVSILRERLKSIEEEYTQYKLNKDRLLLNARYKSDKGSFNVSIISLSSNEEEIDYELFALTKSVIELSLNKIDIVYMENLIDFYTLVGKFDYDMADILFEILDSQINPVIDIPEEEIITDMEITE